GNLSSPRGFLKGVSSNGRQVFIGGADSAWDPRTPPLTNVDTFDGGAWLPDQPVKTPRLFPTATAFPGGVLVTGGIVDNAALATVEIAAPFPDPSTSPLSLLPSDLGHKRWATPNERKFVRVFLDHGGKLGSIQGQFPTASKTVYDSMFFG